MTCPNDYSDHVFECACPGEPWSIHDCGSPECRLNGAASYAFPAENETELEREERERLEREEYQGCPHPEEGLRKHDCDNPECVIDGLPALPGTQCVTQEQALAIAGFIEGSR